MYSFGIKDIQIFVQPSPLPIPITLFILDNWHYTH